MSLWRGVSSGRRGSTRMRSASRSTPINPASIPRARAPPNVASWNASSDGRTVGSRWANFWRSAATFIVSNMSRLLLLAAPSVPRPMTTAASFIAAYGIAWPVESFMFEMGQCATRVPVRASSSISGGSSQHPWAAMTSLARNPRPSRYFAGRTPVCVTQSSTSRLVSERWMYEGTALVREFADPEERVFRDGVNRVRTEHGRDPVRLQRLDPAVHLVRGPQLLRGPFRVVQVHEPFGEERAEAHLLHRLRRGVHVEVHVVEGRRAGLDHLEASELGAPIHVVGSELRLGRPDLRLQPRRQLEVVSPAAEQGHRGVRVQVHESGERDLPFPVDDRVRFALFTDLGDPVSLDVHLGDVALDLDISDEDAHRIRSNAFPTTVRVRSAFCRCVSRIFSNVSGSSTIPLQKLSTVHREA